QKSPQEARRINTPPMSAESPGLRPRGFFFDLSPPENDSMIEGEAHVPNTRTGHGSTIVRKRSNVTTPSRDWWDTEQHSTPSKSTGRITPKIPDGHGPPPISKFEQVLWDW